MTVEEKLSILEAMSKIAPENASAEDENNLLAFFLPLRSYIKLADPKVFLITGGRGAGKSELFRVLTTEGGLEHILGENDRKRFTKLNDTTFMVGYQASGPESKNFPSSTVLNQYAKAQDAEMIACLWSGLLCAVLLKNFALDQELMDTAVDFMGREQVDDLCRCGNMPEKWLGFMQKNQEKWGAFLDWCDDHFSSMRKQIFVVYDELDRVCSNYNDLLIYIRSLLSFWFTYNNRWGNLKAKIFLRSDLYNAKALHFVDSSKMRAYRLELRWDSLSLYRLLVKRLANCGNELAVNYLGSIPSLLDRGNKTLGYLPGDSEDAFKRFVEKIIGVYMGKDPKRGISYSWVPNHIQDANGELSPRPFLKCFVFAAQELYANPDEVRGKLEGDRLISPSRLQGALVEVSKDRVKELVEDEYAWLSVLVRILKGQSMLMERSEFLKYLALENWPEEQRDSLPATSPEGLLEALESLGIFQETGDGRINAPEIYLHGFGLKRRGGIKRPRS